MRFSVALLSLFVALLPALSCGSKQPPGEADKAGMDAGAADMKTEEPEEVVVSADKRIKEWLGSNLTDKMSSLGKEMGKDIGLKLAENQDVIGKAKDLSKAVLDDKEVKKRLKKIEDRATEGLGKKLTLGWKALKAGGIDEYKKKVSADAHRVAVEVLTVHLKDHVLKDERTAALLKELAPMLKVQGKVAAMTVQENLSPRVAKQILGIALRLVAAGDRAEMASRVEAWIESCNDHTEYAVEKLFGRVAALESVEQAVVGLAIEVIDHERTKRELTQLVVKLVDDKEVNKALVGVYEAAAFEKGDAQIRQGLEKALSLPVVDQELFATLERLAGAEGAEAMIGRHSAKIGEDPNLADLAESFIMGILEACGDPTEQ